MLVADPEQGEGRGGGGCVFVVAGFVFDHMVSQIWVGEDVVVEVGC